MRLGIIFPLMSDRVCWADGGSLESGANYPLILESGLLTVGTVRAGDHEALLSPEVLSPEPHLKAFHLVFFHFAA